MKTREPIDEDTLLRRVQQYVYTLPLTTEEDRSTAVNAQLQKLVGIDKSRGKQKQEMYAKRINTVLGMVDTVLYPNITRESVLQREGTVGHRVFYSRKKDWYHHPVFREVLETVLAIFRRWKAEEGERLAAEKLRKWNEQMMETADLMAQASKQILTNYIEQPFDVTIDDKNGEKITKLTPKANVRDVAVIAPAADKIARMAMGQPTDKTTNQLTGEDGKPIEVTEKLPDDVLSRRMSILLAAAKQRKEQTEQDE